MQVICKEGDGERKNYSVRLIRRLLAVVVVAEILVFTCSVSQSVSQSVSVEHQTAGL